MINKGRKATLKIYESSRKRIPFSAPILLWLLLILGFLSHVATAQQPKVNVKALGSIVMNVSDMDRSVDFYSKVLSFEKVSEFELGGPEYEKLFGVDGLRIRVAVMRLEEQNIELIQYIAPKDGDPIPMDSRSNDLWFQHFAIVVSDMDKAYAQLQKYKVKQISTNPQTLPETNKAAAGIRAVKFFDPDRHPLELLWFPLDKGDPRWHSSTEKVFLGIDHTAIGIGDTEASLKFYSELLGLRVAGGSINKGMEQDNLDNVNGAMGRITSLRPQTTFPGIEILEYEKPEGGRPIPTDTDSNDIWRWHTKLVVDDLNSTVKWLRENNARFISLGVVTLPDDKLGFSKGVIVLDPDGHAMLIVEK